MPLSKSVSNRRLILDAVAGVTTNPEDVADCDDTQAMLMALSQPLTGHTYINIGAAGTAMRFLTAYFAALPGSDVTLDGTERMRRRPIGILVDVLRQHGAHIEYVGEEGFPPLKINGKRLSGGSLEVPGNISSQFISALLMIAPTMERELDLKLLPPVVSQPYIEMTRRMIQEYHPSHGKVEADWTAASYWFELMALTDLKINLIGLSHSRLQGDEIVERYFGLIEEAHKSGVGLELDLRDTPDLAQTLMATCCGLGVPFRFDGLSTLPIKETDRLQAMKTELAKLGFAIEIVDGNSALYDGNRGDGCPDQVISTYEDHRMAMAFAPLAVKFPGLRIENPRVVTKSYPGFWEHLRHAGFTVTFSES